jgi:UDP-N-acetylglucosamine:LPS N-acetylglucosamine transferase
VFRPTPGQEVANAEYLVAGGAAVQASDAEDVAARVQRWLSDPAARERARESAGRLGAPQAAETIARRVLAAIPAGSERTA